jgi:signal transduction histidine kinase
MRNNRLSSKSKNHHQRPVLMLIASGRGHAPRLRSVLEEAGFRVETPKPNSLRLRNAPRPRGRSAAAPAAGREDVTLAHFQHDLRGRESGIEAMLKICVDLSPGVQVAGLALYDPQRGGCVRQQCLGPQARTVPKQMAWDRFPLLRIAYENRLPVYVAELPDAPAPFSFALRNSGGCLAIPLMGKHPAAVLFLAHGRAEPLGALKIRMLVSMAHALETEFDNAILTGRLSVSETRYRSLLFAAPFLIALLDSRGTVLQVNPTAIRELRRQGIPLRRAIGVNLLGFPGTPEEIRMLISEGLKTGAAVSREKISVPLPRGVEMLRAHAFPLSARGPGSRELLVIGEKITRYQQIIDEAERTERLAAIGRVAASLAHEINNPLQALRSHLELIRSYPLSDEEREQSFRILEREVERLDETTRRVLGFARPAPDILQPVSILAVLEQALELSKSYLRNQRVEILTSLPEDLPPVSAAAGQLIQVFLNIILNAAHAMRGKGELAIRVRSLGESAEIRFANDGPPIPSEHLARIFDPFFTTRPEGTGLGLSISHAILQRHHGSIRAANLPRRKGVEFVITLPFASAGS